MSQTESSSVIYVRVELLDVADQAKRRRLHHYIENNVIRAIDQLKTPAQTTFYGTDGSLSKTVLHQPGPDQSTVSDDLFDQIENDYPEAA